jgi:hypothetical protein
MKRIRRARLSQTGGVRIPSLKPAEDLDWDAIRKELSDYFNSNEDAKHAKDALERLVAAGCDERSILQNLYLFCGGNPEAMRDLRAALDFAGCRKRMLDIAALLQKTQSGIRVAEQLLEDLGFTHNLTPDCSSLVRYADFLNRAAKIAYSNLASRRIGGRDQHLVYLCRMVEYVTGREHYGEVTDLVNATRQLYDPSSTETETAESIRKRVSRHGIDLGSELELIEMYKATRLPRPT